MPELPEVEVTRRGIAPCIEGQSITSVFVRQPQLRWPVPPHLDRLVDKQTVQSVGRRGKYLLLKLDRNSLIIHLGMSGALRLLMGNDAPGKHDHWDLQFGNNLLLRYTDPRRFGSLHLSAEPESHWLLEKLGPEPLASDFNGDYLYRKSRNRRVAIKHFVMDAGIVAGIGNIYACEALYLAGIHPKRAAGRIALTRYRTLAAALKAVLDDAITQGGTTLRDFLNADGKPGYFGVALHVYGRAGGACHRCGHPVKRISQGQRGTWYCPGCQH